MPFYGNVRGHNNGASYLRGHHFHHHHHHHPGVHFHHVHNYQQQYERHGNFINLMQSDLSTSMMVVYPNGGVGFISTASLASMLFDGAPARNNTNNNRHQSIAGMADGGGGQDDEPPTPLISVSEISVKSAPAEYSCSSSVVEDHSITYKPGDKCWAPYIDGNYYLARFEASGLADLCAVFFHFFGHHSYVPISAIVPSSPNASSS